MKKPLSFLILLLLAFGITALADNTTSGQVIWRLLDSRVSPMLGSWRVGVGSTTPYAKLAITGTEGQTNPLFQIASSTNAVYLTVSNLGVTTLTDLTVSGTCTGCSGATLSPDVVVSLINGTNYLNASTTNLAWLFRQGFVSGASSTIASNLTVSASSTFSGLVQMSNLFVNGSSTVSGILNLGGSCSGCDVTIPLPFGSSTVRVERLLFRARRALVVESADGNTTCYGNACKAGVTFNIMHGTTLDTRVNLFLGSTNIASTSAGTTLSAFNDNTIAAGEWIWYVPTGASTTLNDFALTINAFMR